MNATIIAVDFDEVLKPLVEPMRSWHKEHYTYEGRIELFGNYNFWEAWDVSAQEAARRFMEYILTGASDEVLPIADAYGVLSRLKKAGAELHMVSSRQMAIRQKTLNYLEKHFPGIFTQTHFGNYFAAHSNHRQISKPEMCRKIGATVLVDDLPHFLVGHTDRVLPICFGDYVWNQNLPTGIVRANNWLEVEQIISART